MPIPTPKGGVMRLPADTTAGHRGDPRKLAQQGGTQSLPAARRPAGEEIGSDVRGGNTSVPAPGRAPSSGDGTGQ